ncbi:CoA activase [Bacteroidetes/Chlorobi group bacterium ChocPot_Mid]|nr:MAG: CoA activase [Bacteroidetes/Chlorobi group bacterium ChocPot_Mid]
MLDDNIYKAGIDIGSTTAKISILGPEVELLYSDYKRHLGSINRTLLSMFNDLRKELGNIKLSLALTGSAGLGISEKNNLPFVQELIASTEFIEEFFPEIKTLIDIGGEDSKIIFFDSKRGHDLRMNGSCAGGTGAFIDQMATLLDLSLQDFDELASRHKEIYSIASRCGVFAKTDVQNLISREIPKPDICASVYEAVSLQIKNTLMRGKKLEPRVMLAGGPLTFLPNLKKSLMKQFGIAEGELSYYEKGEFIPSIGAALSSNERRIIISVDEIIESLIRTEKIEIVSDSNIEPLFRDTDEFTEWKEFKSSVKAKRVELSDLNGKDCFLGVDSGSTTTKIVLIDELGRIAFDYYQNNGISSIDTVKKGLLGLKEKLDRANIKINIRSEAVTGYGEDLIKAAFDFDSGLVETIAHYRAAKEFADDVSFILDIGGQDMKAIFVKDGIIDNIEINEACSSGCGSFIETFANSLNYSVEKFAQIACEAKSPCNLGSRCTVFMNSKVKESFRQGSPISDISAGLAYSVIQNCLHKVLKVYDNKILGDKIVVQGGTFKNKAIHRAFEKISGKKVICPDISELMGAYGAALYAKEMFFSRMVEKRMNNSITEETNSKLSEVDNTAYVLNNLENTGNYSVKYVTCRACENYCKVSKLTFNNNNVFFTGNRCENVFSNTSVKNYDADMQQGENLVEFKYKLLFERELSSEESKPRATQDKNLPVIGIPRVLNMFENYPFWHKLFSECGFTTTLSETPNKDNYNLGSGTLMSDNICYPAKIVHSHIMDLINKKVDRIFYPTVNYEKKEFEEMTNCFNCPVVTGYPTVIESSVNPAKYGIQMDIPNINFKDDKLLKKACYRYFTNFGISKRTFDKAFSSAMAEAKKFKDILRTRAVEILIKAVAQQRKVFIIAQRPYQIDPEINHDIPKMFAGLGYDVLTEDSLPYADEDKIENMNILSQWSYPNRLYKAAKWSLKYDNIEFVQLNNFGCGPDTILIDEIKEMFAEHGKNHAVIRIDEHSAPGSLKLRIRSLIESINLRDKFDRKTSFDELRRAGKGKLRMTTKPFTESDRDRLIIVPFFSLFHSAYASAAFESMGYKVEQLPESNQTSIDLGLKYVNNEICYPATLITGDILQALESGKYDLNNVAVGITQTGGQCRASNYLPLLKKAMVKRGYHNVPVVGVTLTNQKLNEQPGFKLNKVKFVMQGLTGLIYGDAISRMYYSIAPREINKGDAKKVSDKYAAMAQEHIASSDKKGLIQTLKKAVAEFNKIPVRDFETAKIGIVGEVYVKYNSIGNNHTIAYLLEHGIEPVIPPIVNMFTQWFVNINVKNEKLIDKRPIAKLLTNAIEPYFNKIDRDFEDALKDFRYYAPKHSIKELAKYAEKAVNLSSQYYGEGWLIAGDILAFAKDGIENVLCLQPFGCLANHVVARGIENKLKEIQPNLNILYLDIDAGVSPVNLHNRLYLLIKNAQKKTKVFSSDATFVSQ